MRHAIATILLAAAVALGGAHGCATGPGAGGDAFQASALRVATSAYILRGETEAERTRRASRLLIHAVELELVATELAEDGRLADAALAAAARDIIEAAGLSERDRLLAEAIITEAIMLYGAQAPALADDQRAKAAAFADLLGQVRRVAKIYAGPER